VPNPESALNEEAGKLLLESHDEYSERAKMMTEIHAQVICYLIKFQFIFFNFISIFILLVFILNSILYSSMIYNFFREVEKAVRLV
jgi:hypothetical protein